MFRRVTVGGISACIGVALTVGGSVDLSAAQPIVDNSAGKQQSEPPRANNPFRSEADDPFGPGPVTPDRIRLLIEKLDAEDVFTRTIAVSQLGRMGPAAADAVPALEKLLGANDLETVDTTVSAIGKIAGAGADDVSRLLEELASKDPLVRRSAAARLAAILGRNAFCRNPEVDLAPIIDALMSVLDDPRPDVRLAAVVGLKNGRRRDEKVGARLIRLAKAKDALVREAAISAIVEVAIGRQGLDTLIEALGDPKVRVREAATKGLAMWHYAFGSKADDVVGALMKVLEDEWSVKYWSVIALGHLGDQSAPAVPKLCDMLAHGVNNPEATACVAWVLAEALGTIVGQQRSRFSGHIDSLEEGAGGYADPLTHKKHISQKEVNLATSVLSLALTSTDESVAGAAADSLANLGVHAKAAVPALRRALSHDSFSVRSRTAVALEYIGPAAGPAIPELRRALKDEATIVRENAVRALARLGAGSDEMAKDLADMLDDEQESVRHYAALALLRFGDFGYSLLLQAMKSQAPRPAAAAASAFSHAGPRTAEVATALGELLSHRDENVRLSASWALSQFGAAAFPAKDVLLGVLIDGKEPSSRHHAVRALAHLQMSGLDVDRISRVQCETAHFAGKVLTLLLRHPDCAAPFLQANPDAISALDIQATCNLIDRAEPEYQTLVKSILDSPKLPSAVMAWSGNARYLPALRQRMAAANTHERTFLSGCLRACGQPADRIIRLSEETTSAFRPASAAGGDRRRMPPRFSGHHGDGTTQVIVTGRVLMPDGSPARNPKLFDSTNRMLVPEDRRDPLPLKYDARTGRFVFLARVFAAYASGGEQAEPGPYQTGPGVVSIEAEGAKPFRFVFFDEMPEVTITLSSRSSPKPSNDE